MKTPERKRIVVLTALGLAITIVIAFIIQRGDHAQVPADDGPWQPIIAFEVTDTAQDHQGDIGNGTIVVANYERPIGWDIGVFAHPLSESSDNLLYDGTPDHGPQPWQSFAWSKRKQLYPDIRVIEYGTPPQKLKIVLENCQTAKQNGVVVFTTGKIAVYHQP